MRVQQVREIGVDGVPGVTMASVRSASRQPERVKVDVAVLEAGASLPRHPAGNDQTFYVVAGQGRVAGDDDVPHPISAGWAATWQAGEQHTSWADSAMTVVIVQHKTP